MNCVMNNCEDHLSRLLTWHCRRDATADEDHLGTKTYHGKTFWRRPELRAIEQSGVFDGDTNGVSVSVQFETWF